MDRIEGFSILGVIVRAIRDPVGTPICARHTKSPPDEPRRFIRWAVVQSSGATKWPASPQGAGIPLSRKIGGTVGWNRAPVKGSDEVGKEN
jgi:hypothetical protein